MKMPLPAEQDVLQWRPQRRFGTVFFAFRLSHVPPFPPSRLGDFWNTVAAALAPPRGEFIIGSAEPRSAPTPPRHHAP